MTNQINVKNIVAYVKNTVSYSVIISGFSTTSLWFIDIRDKISLALSMKKIGYPSVSLSILLKIALETMELTGKILTILGIKLSLSPLAKITYKITVAINTLLSLDTTGKLRSKYNITLNNLLGLAATIIAAVFNLLSDYDAETLSTLDPQTLGVLDYTAT